jgi:SAM-dependent methyltransferase
VSTPADSDARSHDQRDVAEGFGANAARYDRSRPSYPSALIDRIIEDRGGPELLDVGCGTGIASRLFQRAGCDVLGLDADVRMAEIAASSGVQVEVAKFEDWEPAGRTFDIVVAAQAWHWIDPEAGAAKAAQVLRPGGRIALFWNAADEPSELRQAFGEVYGRVLPGSRVAAFYRRSESVADSYSAFLDTAADGMARANAYSEPERWRYDWERTYSRDEWLSQVPTQGSNNLLRQDQQEELLAGIAAAIDAAGGGFTMSYATLVVTSRRR